MTTNEKQMLKNNKLMLKMDREREERRTHIHHYKSSWEGNVCCICNKPKIKFYSDIKPKNTFAKGVQKRFSNGKKVSDKLRRLI